MSLIQGNEGAYRAIPPPTCIAPTSGSLTRPLRTPHSHSA